MALIRTKTIAKAKERSSTVTKGGVTYQKVDTAALAEVATIAKNLAENSSDWAKIDQKDRAVLAAAMQALAEASAALDGKYLSKTGDDTAEGVITFKNGLISLALALLQGGAEYGRFVEGVSGGRIDADGNGELENLTVRDSIVVPNLTVTKAAHFFKLIIDELKSIGGQIIVTAANATLDKVVAMTSTGNEAGDGDTIAYWRCYFRAKDADGNYDFECIGALDTEQFNEDMSRLLKGETVEIPKFNFRTGTREYNGNYLKLEKNDILVIEGIHCLNDAMSYSLPAESKYKIYVSCLTQMNIDEHNRFPTSDARLLRRIVRDARTRGYDARSTLARWPSVNRGEHVNIFPYQDSADAIFNSALIYETAVMKPYVEALLFGVPRGCHEYVEAKRLLKFLDYFLAVPSDIIPLTSICREFIGGGIYKV